jgi:Domain of unknown function (DUF4337)
MPEIEVHHADVHGDDPRGQRVGVLVGVMGVLLAVVTIASHREHTAAVVHKTEANDAWSYMQAKKIRENAAEVASALVEALGADATRTAAARERFEKAAAKYKGDAAEIEADARAKEAQTHHAEHRALYFDLGEGFLELGLVLSSLYFLGRQRLFPIAGAAAALAGVLLALYPLVV